MIATVNIFHWHHGAFDVSVWGLIILLFVVFTLLDWFSKR